jgi:hypothetical protein
MSTDLLIGFLSMLFKNSVHKVFLIVYNLTVHHACMVTAWLNGHRDRIELFYPPYSPEINPDQYQNREVALQTRTTG